MDIAIIQKGNSFDIAYSASGKDLHTDKSGLRNLVLILLFTDRRANDDDEIPDGTNNRRGWFYDPLLGSRLWLLARSKKTQSTLDSAQRYCIEALQRLIELRRAKSVSVNTWWLAGREGVLAMHLKITLADKSVYEETFEYYQEVA